ncbi:MAG TPA: hypothetical protein VIL64_03585 [Solirubrobacteraceae bacterium]
MDAANRVKRALAIAALALAVLAAPAAAELRIGIGDQKATMFGDSRFAGLHIAIARYSVAWDTLDVPAQSAALDSWLAQARDAGVSPLLSIDHSRRAGRTRVLPTVAQYAAQMRRLHARYPWVADYAVWNEANYCGEPTCHHVDRMVGYYRALRGICPACHVLAAELLDFPNMPGWVGEFQRRNRGDPHYWGLHNYRDANRLQTANTELLLSITSGEVWFTETGGIVGRNNKSMVQFVQSPAHAALATDWLFHRLAQLSPRVTRIYLYEWNALTKHDSWDTALIGPDGVARPAFRIVQRVVDDMRQASPPPAPVLPPTPPPAG